MSLETWAALFRSPLDEGDPFCIAEVYSNIDSLEAVLSFDDDF